MKLRHLKGGGVLPLDVSIALIELNGMVVILWDLIAILVVWCHMIGPELGLVDHVKELLVALCNALKLLSNHQDQGGHFPWHKLHR